MGYEKKQYFRIREGSILPPPPFISALNKAICSYYVLSSRPTPALSTVILLKIACTTVQFPYLTLPSVGTEACWL